MRNMLALAAVIGALGACRHQSETDVGQTPPETGKTTADTTTTGGYTGQTGRDTVTTHGDTAMVHRPVPDTTRQDTTGYQGGYQPSGQAGQTGRDTITTRGDTALTGRHLPDTSQAGQYPQQVDTTAGRTDTSFIKQTRPDTGAMRHDSM